MATKRADFTLHIDQTSVTVPFKPENGRDLDGALQLLLQTFAEKQKAERPKRWKSMEFRLSGDDPASNLKAAEMHNQVTFSSIKLNVT